MSDEKLWCYSLDDETFNNGSFLTREEAIIDAVKAFGPEPGATIYIGRANHPDLSSFFAVDDLLEGAACRADDMGGEFAVDFPDITEDEKEGLESVILSYLRPLVSIPFYEVSDSESHTITLADLEITARHIDAGIRANLPGEPQRI